MYLSIELKRKVGIKPTVTLPWGGKAAARTFSEHLSIRNLKPSSGFIALVSRDVDQAAGIFLDIGANWHLEPDDGTTD